jgi:hypothetical protein
MQVILQLSAEKASTKLDTSLTGKFNLISEYEHSSILPCDNQVSQSDRIYV